MSRTRPSVIDQLTFENLPCGYCGADPGDWCVTAKGAAPGRRWATWLHGDRSWPIRQAWRLGMGEGAVMAHDGILWRTEPGRDVDVQKLRQVAEKGKAWEEQWVKQIEREVRA